METLNLNFADHTITLTPTALARAILETHDARRGAVSASVNISIPASIKQPEIGQEWQGGTYAGLTLHEGKPAHLIVLPGDMDDAKWDNAVAWAKKQGGELPSRIDALVLWNNLRDQFKKECYWTGEQHADDSAYAWFQSFSYGDQFYWPKGYEYRARAVRRVPIQ